MTHSRTVHEMIRRFAAVRAYEQTVGAFPQILPSAERLLDLGADAGFFERVGELGAHAVRIGSPLAGEMDPISSAQKVARWLLRTAGEAAHGHRHPADFLPWLAVLASDLDRARMLDLTDALEHWRDPVPAWALSGLGGDGAYAYAAGLTLTETLDRLTDAARDRREVLRGMETLAGLRGYRLPDFPPGRRVAS